MDKKKSAESLTTGFYMIQTSMERSQHLSKINNNDVIRVSEAKNQKITALDMLIIALHKHQLIFNTTNTPPTTIPKKEKEIIKNNSTSLSTS